MKSELSQPGHSKKEPQSKYLGYSNHLIMILEVRVSLPNAFEASLWRFTKRNFFKEFCIVLYNEVQKK